MDPLFTYTRGSTSLGRRRRTRLPSRAPSTWLRTLSSITASRRSIRLDCKVLIADGIPATPTGVNFQLPFSAGITISASATLPPATPGQFLFVQLLNPFNVLYTADGFLNGGCNLVGIDAHYGYAAAGPAGNVTYMYDAPAIPLVAPATYAAVVFDATTYVMWQSSLNSSIPVPLGYIDWSWTGTAFYLPVALWAFGPLVANTLQAGPFTASAVYPT